MRFFLVGFLVVVCTAASARVLTSAETKSLEAKLEEFSVAISENDTETVMRALPPRILAHLAEISGVSTEVFIEAAAEHARGIMSEVEIRDFSVEVGEFDATDAISQDGSQIVHGLVPMSLTTVTTDGWFPSMRHESKVLAIHEEGSWYLLRLSSIQHLELLYRIYPVFSDFSLPERTSTVIFD